MIQLPFRLEARRVGSLSSRHPALPRLQVPPRYPRRAAIPPLENFRLLCNPYGDKISGVREIEAPNFLNGMGYRAVELASRPAISNG